MTHYVKFLMVSVCAFSLISCASPSAPTRPDRPDNPPQEQGPQSIGKADGFDWGSGCSGGSGTFNQAIAKDAVVMVGAIPKDKANVEIKLTCDEDVDIQLFDEDGTKVVQWPDGLFNEADEETKQYKGVRITYSGYNGDGTNTGHESIKIEGVLPNDFVMKAYGYAAGTARIDYSWEAKPGCVESGSGSFQQDIPHDGVVTVGDIIKDLTNVKVKLTSPVDIDIQIYDGSTKVVHWSDGIIRGADKVTKTYQGMRITWSGYNGDGTGAGNEYIEIDKTTRKLKMKVYGYEAGIATVNYSWGNGGGSTGGVEAKAIFSPTSKSASHVAEAVKLIKNAQRSVDIAMYSLSDSRVNDALKDAVAAPRNVKVRVIYHGAQKDRKNPSGTKSAKLEDIGVDVRYASKSKVMHHKYMIVDGPRQDDQGHVDPALASTAWLVTGSGNWSGGAQTRYDENTVFLKGVPELVMRYQKEFTRLWNYSHDFVWKNFTYTPAAEIDVSSVPDDPNTHALMTSVNFKENLSFTTIKGSYKVAADVVKEIAKANVSVHVASGHFRSWPIYEALYKLRQAKPGVDIKVYLDGQEYISDYWNNKEMAKLQACVNIASTTEEELECKRSGYYYARELDKKGVPLKFKYYAYRWAYEYAPQMHNKYIIIDGRKLLTGSYNYSDNAERGTMENVVILSGPDFQAVVQQYEASFKKLWETDKNKTKFNSWKDKIQNSSSIPLTFSPMALSWAEATEIKDLIYANCPLIDSVDYKKNPQNHTTCPRNP